MGLLSSTGHKAETAPGEATFGATNRGLFASTSAAESAA